jgi:hypothetical protein
MYVSLKYYIHIQRTALSRDSCILCTIFQVDHRGAEGILEESYGEMVNQLGNSNIR